MTYHQENNYSQIYKDFDDMEGLIVVPLALLYSYLYIREDLNFNRLQVTILT